MYNPLSQRVNDFLSRAFGTFFFFAFFTPRFFGRVSMFRRTPVSPPKDPLFFSIVEMLW